MECLVSRRASVEALQTNFVYGGIAAGVAYFAGLMGLSLLWLLLIMAALLFGLGGLRNRLGRLSEMNMAQATIESSLGMPHKDGESTEWVVSTNRLCRMHRLLSGFFLQSCPRPHFRSSLYFFISLC